MEPTTPPAHPPVRIRVTAPVPIDSLAVVKTANRQRPDILLDITRLMTRRLKSQPLTGIDRVGLAYIKHYGPKARALVSMGGVPIVCGERSSQTLFDWLLGVASERDARRSLAASLVFGSRGPAHQGAWLINPSHAMLDSAWWLRSLRRMQVRSLYVVHDLVPVLNPQHVPPGQPARCEAHLAQALRHASGVVCNSRSTLADLRMFATDRSLPLPPSVCVPLAPELPLTRVMARPQARPYFVCIGSIEPRKNQAMLLQVWQRLVDHLGDEAPGLVLIGHRGFEGEAIARQIERSPALRGTVLELGSCNDEQMVGWLRHAQALLCPSLAEGFGMAVVEAMSHGVPVIASDLAVFREMAGDLPEYLDPLDALGWIDRILAYSRTDCPQRQRQVNWLRKYRAPTWVEHFGKVDELMGRIEAGEQPVIAASVPGPPHELSVPVPPGSARGHADAVMS